MKKILLGFLCMLMVLVSLTACGNDKPQEPVDEDVLKDVTMVDKAVEFTGGAQTIEVANVPTGYFANGVGQTSYSNAGIYEIKYQIFQEGKITVLKELSAHLVIYPQVTLSDQEVNYDGEPKSLTLPQLPSGFVLSPKGEDSFTAAGVHEVTYELKSNLNSDVLKTVSANLNIVLDLSGITISDSEVDYDGKAHTNAVEGSIPVGYEAEAVGDVEYTNPGTYEIKYNIINSETKEVVKQLTSELVINETQYDWSEYISIASKEIYYDGGQKTLNYVQKKKIPAGYKIIALTDTKFTEIGEYEIKYGIVSEADEETVLFEISATLTIIELIEIDYAGEISLDKNSGRTGLEVTVLNYVDGDTTHFNVPDSVIPGGVLKARYLAINTPESTGSIEPYGKKASNFTKETLKNAYSIYIESDGPTWEADSTGSRYLTWVWYRNSEQEPYRNLNIEILQNGLALASNSAQNSYGETAVAALNQAKIAKKNLYSGEKDPDFYYGAGIVTTIKNLVLDPETYNNKTVVFEGDVYRDYNQGVYVVDYDDETGTTFGLYVYYGASAVPGIRKALNVGNRVHFVGKLQYYETGGSWQVAGLEYRAMNPESPESTHVIGKASEVEYLELDYAKYKANSNVEFVLSVYDAELEEEKDQSFFISYRDLLLGTPVEVKNGEVVGLQTTTKEESSSKGAVTITVEANSMTIDVRTDPFYDTEKLIADEFVDEKSRLILQSYYEGRVISAKGVLTTFNGGHQIRVFNISDITFNEINE